MHCHLAASDPAAIMKAVSDMLLEQYRIDCLPAKLKISGSGCINNCGEGSCADIGIVAVHRDLPSIKADKLKGCELPLVISVCPTGAIKPKGPNMVEIDPKRCIHCPACSVACAAMAPIGSPDGDGVAIVVGGKAANTGDGPAIARVVVANPKTNTNKSSPPSHSLRGFSAKKRVGFCLAPCHKARI
jgi:sulfite reductase beta subunit